MAQKSVIPSQRCVSNSWKRSCFSESVNLIVWSAAGLPMFFQAAGTLCESFTAYDERALTGELTADAASKAVRKTAPMLPNMVLNRRVSWDQEGGKR